MEANNRINEAAVFVSYSRRDSAPFVEELHVSLETCGFDCYYDKQDIASGEDWEMRLRSLVSGADTTLVIITEAWVASHECVKELDIALDLGRRVIPVLKEQIDPAKLPPALSRLQFVFFCGESHSYARGVASLVKALREDLTWIRAQSRYLALAHDWEDSGRSDGYLLRGAALEDGLAWFHKPTPERVNIPPLIKAFFNASENAETVLERKKLRSRIRQLALVGVTVTSLLGGGMAYAMIQAENERLAAQIAEREARQAQNDVEDLQGQLLDTYVFNSQPEQMQQKREPQFDRSQYQLKVEPKKFEVRREGGGDKSDGTYPIPAPPPPPRPDPTPTPVPEPTPDADKVNLEKLISDLSAEDSRTRLGAGQLVADLVRSDDNQDILKQLVQELAAEDTGRLTSNGRYNVLYMLNLADSAALNRAAGADLRAALTNMDERAGRTKGGWIGNNTRDCMTSLEDKLNGKEGKTTCGR